MVASRKPQPRRPKSPGPTASIVGLARARYLRGSTRKLRAVAQLVRTRPASKALEILAVTNKGAARPLTKIVKSAIANALRQHPQLTIQALRISRIVVDDGPMWKRFRAVAMGRATPIRKRTSHVTVEIASVMHGT